MADLLAYAVVHDDPPTVFAAEDMDVLHWVLALELVAKTPAGELSDAQRQSVRQALLDERWGDAVGEWIDVTGVAGDVYTDRFLWNAADVETAVLGLQFTLVFAWAWVGV